MISDKRRLVIVFMFVGLFAFSSDFSAPLGGGHGMAFSYKMESRTVHELGMIFSNGSRMGLNYKFTFNNFSFRLMGLYMPLKNQNFSNVGSDLSYILKRTDNYNFYSLAGFSFFSPNNSLNKVFYDTKNSNDKLISYSLGFGISRAFPNRIKLSFELGGLISNVLSKNQDKVSDSLKFRPMVNFSLGYLF